MLENIVPTRRRVGGRALSLALAAVSLLTAACADSPTALAPEVPAVEAIQSPSLATATDISWWGSLTNLQRGQAVEAEAKRWVGSTSLSSSYRCNCKEFARYAVTRATRGVVYLGATVDQYGNTYWKGYRLRIMSHMMKVTDHSTGSIGQTMVGDVIQANNRSSNPHTMIISRVTSDYVYLVDANWGGCGVRSRTVSRSSFTYNFPKWTAYRMI